MSSRRARASRRRAAAIACLAAAFAALAGTVVALSSNGRAARAAVAAAGVARGRAGGLGVGAARGRAGRVGAEAGAAEGLVPVGPLARGVAAATLRRRLARALEPAGADVGLLVESLSGSGVSGSGTEPLAARNAARMFPPASVEKLYTSAAALDLLGPGARLKTTVLGAGTLSHGIWRGNLYLRGGGDPTLGDGSWNKEYERGYGPTALELAEQLERDGIRRVRGHIFADDSLFDTDPGGPATHNRPDIPDYGGELGALVYDHGMTAPHMSAAVFTAHELALTMRSMGLQVAAASRTARTPEGAVPLASVSSPPLAVLLSLMNVPSDDLIADMLAKQLGARLEGHGTLAAGARVIAQTLAARYGLTAVIHDGSGLDRADRTSPEQVVSLLRDIYGTRVGEVLAASLPVVGEQGTVTYIGAHTPAQGRCRAKTGTLDNVTNLAGYCSDRAGGRLAFAIMLVGPTNAQAVPLLSRAVAAIAAY